MWNLAGHEIELGGGPYDFDHGDPLVIVHCCRCPDGSEDGWVLWRNELEDGDPVDPQAGLSAIVGHLRDDDVHVTDHVLDSALTVAALEGLIEPGLDLLQEQLRRAAR